MNRKALRRWIGGDGEEELPRKARPSVEDDNLRKTLLLSGPRLSTQEEIKTLGGLHPEEKKSLLCRVVKE